MSHKYVWYSLMINFTDGSLKKIHKHEYRPQLGSQLEIGIGSLHLMFLRSLCMYGPT